MDQPKKNRQLNVWYSLLFYFSHPHPRFQIFLFLRQLVSCNSQDRWHTHHKVTLMLLATLKPWLILTVSMFFLITQKNHQTEFCFTLILKINNATVMKRLTEITVLTPSEVQLRIDQILKKFNGSCQQSHLLTHSTYVHSSTARNLVITWSLIREGCFSCVISPHSQEQDRQSKPDQRLLKNFHTCTLTWQ